MAEALGWICSAVLVVTIGQQVYKQWHDGTSKGVSTWLFVGQMLASAGFTLYSVLVHNWVFVVTNALMLVSAVVGFAIVLVHRRREKAAPSFTAELNDAFTGRASALRPAAP